MLNVTDVAEHDASVLSYLQSARLHTIEDVLLVMDHLDETLPKNDGIRWFNFLYRLVTQEVHESCKRNVWKNTPWLICLDVEFAKLFFAAIEAWLTHPELTPRAWFALFENRSDTRVSPIQFGLAGINAHINRDLPVAIVRAQQLITHRRPTAHTDEEADFLLVNAILDKVEGEALQNMATGWIKKTSDFLDPIDKKAAMKAVSLARKKAWQDAAKYWDLLQADPQKAEAYLNSLDRVAETIGKGLLVPTYAG